MDGAPNPKTKTFRGQLYSDTRYYVCLWLEKELPKISGDVINISSGGWPIPKQLLDFKRVKQYKTFDQKMYGDTNNTADFYGDVHSMPKEWTNKWDCIINNQSIECYANPFKAVNEMHRILKPSGILYIDLPLNYRWFGDGSGGVSKPKNPVKDYWRITEDGVRLLLGGFSKVDIQGFGGTGKHDRYVYCAKAIK
jgi:SAM-dependent methyltransferase